jgi:carbon-monoxide dehydrogenase medium subunit
MKPAAFEHTAPAELTDALALLGRPGAKPLSGGQSLSPMMNLRLVRPATLVDLKRLPGLRCMVEAADHIRFGAATTHAEIEDGVVPDPTNGLMPHVAHGIAYRAVRNRGTLGGSLCNADPVAQLCLMAITLDGHMLLARDGSRRSVRARDFFKAAMSTDLQPDELLVGLRVPKLQPQEASAYRMFNRRHGDYAIVASAVTLRLAAGQVEALRLGIAGNSPVPQRLSAVEDAYRGQAPTVSWVDAVAKAVAAAVDPEDDPQIPAAYRRQLAQEMTARALTRCLQRLGVPTT